jgi:pimeloyl-ACP methyl ester carboxylesterase
MAATAHLRPPPLRRAAMEWLSVYEVSAFHPASPLFAFVKSGDGHPVLILPGFVGSDRSTAPLRQLLRMRGHDAHGWLLGANYGAHAPVMSGMYRRLEHLHERTGRMVTIVGWSLGGMFARELARDRPTIVRQVITLSAPFRFRDGDRGHASALYDAFGPRAEPFTGRSRPEHERPEMPVPVSSIYTRTDGVVPWHACIEEVGPRRENIEVRATHTGIATNMLAAIAVADRLAQAPDRWRPFRAPLPLRPWFPRPTTWRPPEG